MNRYRVLLFLTDCLAALLRSERDSAGYTDFFGQSEIAETNWLSYVLDEHRYLLQLIEEFEIHGELPLGASAQLDQHDWHEISRAICFLRDCRVDGEWYKINDDVAEAAQRWLSDAPNALERLLLWDMLTYVFLEQKCMADEGLDVAPMREELFATAQRLIEGRIPRSVRVEPAVEAARTFLENLLSSEADADSTSLWAQGEYEFLSVDEQPRGRSFKTDDSEEDEEDSYEQLLAFLDEEWRLFLQGSQ